MQRKIKSSCSCKKLFKNLMMILNYNDEITTAYALTVFYKIRIKIKNESLKMRFYFY